LRNLKKALKNEQSTHSGHDRISCRTGGGHYVLEVATRQQRPGLAIRPEQKPAESQKKNPGHLTTGPGFLHQIVFMERLNAMKNASTNVQLF
jgi:hypothetical protein